MRSRCKGSLLSVALGPVPYSLILYFLEASERMLSTTAPPLAAHNNKMVFKPQAYTRSTADATHTFLL